jgi:hypothetical protein
VKGEACESIGINVELQKHPQDRLAKHMQVPHVRLEIENKVRFGKFLHVNTSLNRFQELRKKDKGFMEIFLGVI